MNIPKAKKSIKNILSILNSTDDVNKISTEMNSLMWSLDDNNNDIGKVNEIQNILSKIYSTISDKICVSYVVSLGNFENNIKKSNIVKISNKDNSSIIDRSLFNSTSESKLNSTIKKQFIQLLKVISE